MKVRCLDCAYKTNVRIDPKRHPTMEICTCTSPRYGGNPDNWMYIMEFWDCSDYKKATEFIDPMGV